MSVRRAQEEVDSAEFTEWMAYFSLEPFGSQIDDMRHGIAVATLANINRNQKTRRKPFAPIDFIPWHEAAKDPDKPILLDDPDKQTELMIRSMFGKMKVQRSPP